MTWEDILKKEKKKLVVTERFKEWLKYWKRGGRKTWLQWK